MQSVAWRVEPARGIEPRHDAYKASARPPGELAIHYFLVTSLCPSEDWPEVR